MPHCNFLVTNSLTGWNEPECKEDELSRIQNLWLKSEIRRPKSEGRPKPEGRKSKERRQCRTGAAVFGFRNSAFGFQGCWSHRPSTVQPSPAALLLHTARNRAV